MANRQRFTVALGAATWCVIAAATWWSVASSRQSATQKDAASQRPLLASLTSRSVDVPLISTSGPLRAGDPVFLRRDDGGELIPVGFIVSTAEVASAGKQAGSHRKRVTVRWHRADIDPDGLVWLVYQNDGDLQEILTTLLPPAKRDRIRQRIDALLQQHGQEISAAMVPLVRQSILESLPIIEDGFRASIARNRPALEALGKRIETDVIEKRLLPLAKQAVLPTVRLHAQPVVETIGRELWDRASLWRFGWRAVYDKLPLSRREMVREEWTRFVEQEAIPVFEAHTDEIVVAIQRTLADVADNAQVRKELASVVDELASDQQAKQILKTVIRETLLENEPLRSRWQQIWSSDHARQAIQLASDRVEPVIRQIGDELFGTPEDGINPEFAKVLRNQILGKDRRWLVAAPPAAGATADGLIRPGTGSGPFPIVYIATP